MSSAPSAHRVPGDDGKPYGTFEKGDDIKYNDISTLERTGSFTVGMGLNPPINRYGLMTTRRHTRILNSPGMPFAAPLSSAASTPGFRGLTSSPPPPLGLPRTDSAFSSLLEASKTTVFLPTGECNLTMTVFNMANCLVGSGILGLPFSLAVGGWAGLLVMFLATIGTSYTGKIIGSCIEHLLIKYPNQGRDRYQDMAQLCCESRVLGKLFKYTINLSIVLELWGGACSRIILQGSNLNKVFPSVSEPFWMVVCTVLLLPSVFVGMEFLAYLSMLGLTSSFLLLGGILVAGVDRGIADDTVSVKWEGLPITFGIVLFSYSGHAVFPQIYRAMADKKGYNQAVDWAFYISFAFYGAMAAGGYLCWGEKVLDQVTLNLPEGVAADSVVLLVVVNTMLSYPLIMTAPIEATEDFMGVNQLRMRSPCLAALSTVVIRSVLVLGTLVVALTVSNFALIATFIGAVFTMSVSLIFPCIIYLKLLHYGLPDKLRDKKGLGCAEILWNIFLILVGIAGMITGVWQGILQLV
ncbi:hypothetical protein AAMO2058_001575000 [Amorphochlora amoebiformis]|uniref:Amino acid transporter transmembrane domain-containing protein n=1 Tax=Amorphochlora amoebiformis TaxID=1561963 RepID=A0A6T6S331_9EUKA|mmetsp:Transcript_11905/g.18912  ORF Transcript_11905/g.18912 Transcript_11905/m.18912 type:complete len:523 (+) Transcript_11905:40-1608(+)